MILAGDIGGTKTVLALYEAPSQLRAPAEERVFVSRDYPGLVELLDEFLAGRDDTIRAACFGLPGAIIDGVCKMPNLGWVTDTAGLAQRLPFDVSFLNDLEATGFGLPALTAGEIHTLHEGNPLPGNAAILAPGTGLGECILVWDGSRHVPSASEGGHCDFAPRTQEQMDFHAWALREKYPRISFDRVASGTGLSLVYEYFKLRGDLAEAEGDARAVAEAEDPAAEISRQATNGECALCSKAMDFWVATLGAEAGNLALKALATAGLYLGGGIPPKILPHLRSGTFLDAFQDKGRLRGVISRIPVRVVLNQNTALLGAARHAFEIAGRSGV